MYYPTFVCDDVTTSVTPVNRVRHFANGRYQVCMTKGVASAIAEGGIVAAFGAPAIFLTLPGSVAFVLLMVGWAVAKWGPDAVPAFCCEFTPARSGRIGMMPTIVPPQLHAIWTQG